MSNYFNNFLIYFYFINIYINIYFFTNYFLIFFGFLSIFYIKVAKKLRACISRTRKHFKVLQNFKTRVLKFYFFAYLFNNCLECSIAVSETTSPPSISLAISKSTSSPSIISDWDIVSPFSVILETKINSSPLLATTGV